VLLAVTIGYFEECGKSDKYEEIQIARWTDLPYLLVLKCIFLCTLAALTYTVYVVGSKSFRPNIQKPRQMENTAWDI